jgi:hypothetical protein
VFFYGLGSAEALERHAKAGTARCVFWLTNARRDTVERELEIVDATIREFDGSA